MFMFVTYATYFSNYRQRMSGIHEDSIILDWEIRGCRISDVLADDFFFFDSGKKCVRA